MSSKEADNNPGLCLVKGQQSGLHSWARAQNHLSILPMRTDTVIVSSKAKCATWYTLLTRYLLTYCMVQSPS